MSYGSRIGSTALARLIAEKSALDTLHHCHTHSTSHGRVDAERLPHDEGEHRGYLREVEHDDHKCQQGVAHGHDRHHDARETRDAFHATKDDDQGGQRKHSAYPTAVERKGVGKSITESIALHNLVGHAKGDSDKHCKENAHPLAVKSILHVVGRTSEEGVRATPFVQLRQGSLNESRSGTEESHHPHPKHSTWTAYKDGRRHTRQIARPHTAGQRDCKGLKRAYLAPFTLLARLSRFLITTTEDRLAHHDAKHVAPQAELHSVNPYGKEEGTKYQDCNDHIPPQIVIGLL